AGTPLAGAVYGVYESQYPHWQYLIDYVTTDSNGVATLDTNDPIYSVQQVTAPTGYPLDTTVYLPNSSTGTIVLNLTQPSSSTTPTPTPTPTPTATPTPTPPPGSDILPTVIWEYTYSGGDWKDQLIRCGGRLPNLADRNNHPQRHLQRGRQSNELWRKNAELGGETADGLCQWQHCNQFHV
ncbi:MAG: prealbumin-like fold domain-containing protein, partial [Clostridiales bacterium]|nr:prealbumin-like fold domain-containing protein [Clostridiales bacterium]